MSDAAILVFPARPEDRLRLAFRRLDEALAEQRAAVGAWRREIGGLAEATSRLGGSLHAFRDNLQALAETTRQAEEQAKRLDRTADAMLALVPDR